MFTFDHVAGMETTQVRLGYFDCFYKYDKQMYFIAMIVIYGQGKFIYTHVCHLYRQSQKSDTIFNDSNT